ncbi:MAG: ATP-dependent endonuclease [Kangiella sp.]|nr:MAG: ATP-dependent endonuclease [Kangiella sp.]
MKISELSIKNFKGLREETFSPKSFSCLVGENNAGKSTVLQALVYALNRPKNIPASMFYDENQAIIFKLKFEEVTVGDLNRLKPEHKKKMEPLVYGGELTLTAKYINTEGVELFVAKLVPVDEGLREDVIKANFTGVRSAAQARAVIQVNYPEYIEELPDYVTPAQAKEFLNQKIAELSPDQFEYIDTTLPSGIPSSISALIPEPIYIPAVKNFEDDLKTTQSTSFGRLMGLLMEDLSSDLQDINDTLLDLKKRLNRYVDDNGDMQDQRLPKVVELESTIEGFLSENFPNISVDLEIPPPEIKTILNTAKIYIDDGSRDLIENKGDGVKRSLTFSLLRAYVEILSRRNAEVTNEVLEDENAQEVLEKPLIFLFEEPELYLHPKAQRILFSTLAAISNDFQTVITTHSPLFFEPGVTAQFVRVAKEAAEPKPIGKLYPVDFDIDQENLNTFRMAKFDHSEAAFFSNHIVLYEGESDDFFFRHMAKTLKHEWSFDDKNIALVEVGGKGNFSKFRKFFKSFGLKVSILCDLDVLVKDFQHLGASEETTVQKGQLLQTLNRRVDELDITAQLTGKRVKKQCKNPRWIEKYEAAKQVISQVTEVGNATAEQIELFNSLFLWEADEAKYTVLTSDDEVKIEVVALLDQLRSEGIYVLSKGAIEEYYPAEITMNISKPERALKVIEHVTTREFALALSSPLVEGRVSEFEEIFSSIFE